MPQVRGQERQARPDLCTSTIPLPQSLDRKAMAEILQAWAMVCAWATHTNLPRQRLQGAAARGALQPCAAPGDEEGNGVTASQAITTTQGVGSEPLLG